MPRCRVLQSPEPGLVLSLDLCWGNNWSLEKKHVFSPHSRSPFVELNKMCSLLKLWAKYCIIIYHKKKKKQQVAILPETMSAGRNVGWCITHSWPFDIWWLNGSPYPQAHLCSILASMSEASFLPCSEQSVGCFLIFLVCFAPVVLVFTTGVVKTQAEEAAQWTNSHIGLLSNITTVHIN